MTLIVRLPCQTQSVFGVVNLPTYLVGLVVIILLPGPNSLYVLAVATRSGIRSAYGAAAGVFTGDLVLMTLAAAGVASLLQSNQVAFSVVKYLGAGYLGWLGLGLLRASFALWRRSRVKGAEPLVDQIADDVAVAARGPRETARSAYRRATVVGLLNPKAILFFVSFFVQFVDPKYPYPFLSFAVLGGLLQIASMVYLSALIFSGSRLAEIFRERKRASAVLSTGAGAVFIGFAVKLSLASAG